MHTRFLETFVTLVQLRNFHATARTLHATPAAVSLRIRSLENDLGVQLIDRKAKSFRLTPKGELLLDYARTVVAAAQKMQQAALDDNPVQGRVRLGINETVVHSWLPQFMKQLAADYPLLEIDLTVDSSAVLAKRLLADELDLAVRVDGIDHPEVVSTALALYPVHWIARKGFLSLRPRDLVHRLLKRPILTFARGTQPQRVLEEIVARLASQEDIPLEQIRMTCSPSVAAIVLLVKEGYGVAAIPSLFVRGYLASGEFIQLPVQPELPSFTVTLCRHPELSPKVQATVNTLRQACLNYGHTVSSRFVKILC